MEILTTPLPVEEKTDIQLQNEALDADVKKTADYEAKLTLSEKIRLAKEPKVEETKAKDLSSSLAGTFEDRIKGTRTLLLTMEYGKKPEVVFTGFWNGKFVGSATNAISRCYRLQRRVNPNNNLTQKTKE